LLFIADEPHRVQCFQELGPGPGIVWAWQSAQPPELVKVPLESIAMHLKMNKPLDPIAQLKQPIPLEVMAHLQ